LSDTAWTVLGLSALAINLAAILGAEIFSFFAYRQMVRPERPPRPIHVFFLVLTLLCLVWMVDEPRPWVRWTLEGFLVGSLAGFAFGFYRRRRL
jgi:hypothetical protein